MLIVITGQDGSGKTTLIKDIADDLKDKKVKVLHLPFSDFVNDALDISGYGKPMGDTYTDRLIFALDNRLVNYHLKQLQQNYDYIILQRGWMDSFIHGAVQGYTYDEIAKLSKVEDLIIPSLSIYLNCEPEVAYRRIKTQKNSDKFETAEYMKLQFNETKRFYDAIGTNSLLANIFREPKYYVDTTKLSCTETFTKVSEFINLHIT